MWLLAPFRLIVRTARRFHGEHCARTAAALSFSTLIGLVPMIAAAFALISLLPAGVGLGPALEKFLLANLLPDKAGVIIAKYVGRFAASAERVTLLGIAVLGATALMQMLTIEHAFNHIWRVKSSRPLLRRLSMHGLALLLGPLVFGASLTAISFVAGVSLGFFNEPYWLNTFVIRGLLPFSFMTALFGLLYWGVPNQRVNAWHAAFGGAMAALGFAGLQKLFTLYIVTGFTVNAAVYGAFSAIPVFLVWLYASWSVILTGALLVAELPQSAHA
ncbi:MAG: YihY family inner membrane protein [Sulfuritalea sp.]|jgi:membrane protein|nr:YihY family inner membrane protein [Sulfuritalea sp.]